MYDSLIRELIIEEMKRDPLFRQNVLNEGFFGDLFSKVKSIVKTNDDSTMESIFEEIAAKAGSLQKVFEKIIKKIASTASTKSESVSNRRVEYLLRNLNEGPERLNEVALVALLAAAKMGALKWGAAMAWTKMAMWLRQFGQWGAKKIIKYLVDDLEIEKLKHLKISEDEYGKLTDEIVRDIDLDNIHPDKRKELEHQLHHDLEEQAESTNKVLMFFARWKRMEHFVEKVLDAPFQGFATALVYCSGGDPKGNDAWFVEDVRKYIKLMFLGWLLIGAITHAKHVFAHLKVEGWKEAISSIKHILVETEEASAVFEVEGATAAEGIITLVANWLKTKMGALAAAMKNWNKFMEMSMKTLKAAASPMGAATAGAALSTESIDRIHVDSLMLLENRNAKLKRRTRKKLEKPRPSRK